MEDGKHKVDLGFGTRLTRVLADEEHFKFTDEETEKERRFVRVSEFGYKEITSASETPPTSHEARTYDVENNDSFVSYIKRHMEADLALISLEASGAMAYFNEKNRKEWVRRKFTLSLEYKKILGAEGSRGFSQKDLLTVIETFPEVFGDDAIAGNIMLINIKKDVEIESNLDPNNYTFVYKEKTGEQTACLHRFLDLTLPVFEGSNVTHKVKAEFEFKAPTEEGEKFTFTLTNHGHERTIREATEAEIAELKDDLNSDIGEADTQWEIIHGNASRVHV